MMNYIIYLNEDSPPPGQPDPASGSPSGDGFSGPFSPSNLNQQGSQQPTDPNIGNVDQTAQSQKPEDVNQDPSHPEMPEQNDDRDFETWRRYYEKESIKGEPQGLIDLLNEVRDRDDLKPFQGKFVEDNFQIQLIRQNSNIEKASRDIRRNIKEQLDRNNPSTTVVNHMVSVLETMPTLANTFIKLKGYGGLKGDLHRKYISALIGAIQVGSGANTEDIIYNERDYSIMISTRMNSDWGEINLGNWALKEDDPEKYLSDPELKRLRDGSPTERMVLRQRVVLESISTQFKQRSFIINVVDEDGTVCFVGWDIASCLNAAYAEGKLIVKLTNDDDSEAFISEKGDIVPYMNLNICYGKETGEQNEDGTPEVKTIKEASDSMQGLVFKQMPYNGNPSDLKVLSRCVFSAQDLIFRQC
jgi:hypothetical protein